MLSLTGLLSVHLHLSTTRFELKSGVQDLQLCPETGSNTIFGSQGRTVVLQGQPAVFSMTITLQIAGHPVCLKHLAGD